MSIAGFLPSGIDLEQVILGMSVLSASVMALAVWSALLQRNPAARRARAVLAQRRAMRNELLTPRRRDTSPHRSSIMHRVVERLRLLKGDQTDKVRTKLMRAGWRSKDSMVTFLFWKLTLPFVAGGLAVFLLYGTALYDMTESTRLLTALAVVLLSAYLPEIYVKNAAQKRQDKIRKALPDTLDLMVICAEAGLSLDATVARVAGELDQAYPEIADELRLTSLELGFLPDRQIALQNLATRTDMDAIRAVVNTLVQAERYGTPLAQSLRVLSAESRKDRVMKAEEKAARLPALMTVPMIIFILPPLFVVLLGPALLDIIDALSNLQI